MTTMRRDYRTADYVGMTLLYGLYAFVTHLSFRMSGFFAMATDSCGVDCDTSGVTRAYLITDGGAAFLFLAVCILGIRALITHRSWVWIPLSAIAIQILLFIIGASQATAVTA